MATVLTQFPAAGPRPAGCKVDMSRSQRIGRVSSEWSSRPDDERYLWLSTLFAALNVLDGTVIGRNMQRHRHQEFIRFLNMIEAKLPAGKAVHVILDNYAAHKHPKVRAWLDRHTRFTFHFTPTSCSWFKAVEGFFAKLTRRRLKRGFIDISVVIF